MGVLTEGAEVALDIVVEADQDEGDGVTSFGPDDANAAADTGLKDFAGAAYIEPRDAKPKRRLARRIILADLPVGFKDEELVVAGKAIEAREVARLVDEAQLALFHAFPQRVLSSAFIGNNVT